MDTLGMASAVLMERAALTVSRAVQAQHPGGDVRVVCLCGPGNNGADGLAVARQLVGRGIAAQAVLVTPRHNAAVAEQLAWARSHGVTVHADLDAAGAPAGAVLVDALLGTGSRGEPRGAVLDGLRWAAGGQGPRIAVDLPSGVDPDTGAVPGEAFCADVTVTFGRSKPGLHITPGRHRAGRVIVGDIGLVAAPGSGNHARVGLVDPTRVRQVLRGLPPGAHKGERGRLTVLGGSAGTPGAAVLVGAAALRAGAGLVTIATDDDGVQAQLVAHRPELMVALHRPGDPLPAADALVVGPGLTGEGAREGLADLYRTDPRPAVWDASALDEVPVDGGEPAGPRVITPHPGEAARLLSRGDDGTWNSARIQAERLETARALATRTGAVAVLKGEGSVLAWDLGGSGGCEVCTTGGPSLATAGSGDCLAGLIGGLLARGLSALDAARVGVHVHGLAGELVARDGPGATAMDIADAVRPALEDCAVDPANWPQRWPG